MTRATITVDASEIRPGDRIRVPGIRPGSPATTRTVLRVDPPRQLTPGSAERPTRIMVTNRKRGVWLTGPQQVIR